jgi:hypothetical protein
MRQGVAERPANILDIGAAKGSREQARDDGTTAQRSGKAIISLLQQAADVARRNEERAKGLAVQLADELRASEERVHALEARLRHFEQRAVDAENWLLRIYDEIQDRLIVPLSGDGQQQERAARR